jgi:hypothetical protein
MLRGKESITNSAAKRPGTRAIIAGWDRARRRRRLDDPNCRTAQTCQLWLKSRRLRLLRCRRLRGRCLWCRGFRCRWRCLWWRRFRWWCRRCGFWHRSRGRLWCWWRSRRGFRGWRRRRGGSRCRCRGLSLRQLHLGGLALVPVHEIGSNDESEHDATQDDSEECPTAGLVVVCHIVVLPLEGSLVQTVQAYRVMPLGSRVGACECAIRDAYAQANAALRQALTAYVLPSCRRRLKSGVTAMASTKFTITE